MYRVIKYFTDLHDKDFAYNEGDTFPRKGITVTKERFAELASDKNKQGEPLIELVGAKGDEADVKKKPSKKAGAKTSAK